MTEPIEARKYRFGVFEADAATGELRKQGLRIKLNEQPFQVLLLLLARPGELLSREEIASELWGGDTFVDFEHGLNSAVNRIREALGDRAANPRFVETLARRGYRFVAPVEVVGAPVKLPAMAAQPAEAVHSGASTGFLALERELPKSSYGTVRTLFVLLQVMYLAFYVGALANLAEIAELFAPLSRPKLVLRMLIVTAGLLIPVRTFLLSAVLFHAPAVRTQFLRLWPFLFPFDVLWALSPLLLLHHINVGLALAFMAPLVYSPFAQRSLILMGAGARKI